MIFYFCVFVYVQSISKPSIAIVIFIVVVNVIVVVIVVIVVIVVVVIVVVLLLLLLLVEVNYENHLLQKTHLFIEINTELCKHQSITCNSPFPNYAPLLTNRTFKSGLGAHFSYICCIFVHLASTRCFCLSAVERNSEMGY